MATDSTPEWHETDDSPEWSSDEDELDAELDHYLFGDDKQESWVRFLVEFLSKQIEREKTTEKFMEGEVYNGD